MEMRKSPHMVFQVLNFIHSSQSKQLKLSPIDKLVLINLASHGERIYPSVGRIANDLGMSYSTIQRSIRNLREEGVISTENRHGSQNTYHLKLSTECANQDQNYEKSYPQPRSHMTEGSVNVDLGGRSHMTDHITAHLTAELTEREQARSEALAPPSSSDQILDEAKIFSESDNLNDNYAINALIDKNCTKDISSKEIYRQNFDQFHAKNQEMVQKQFKSSTKNRESVKSYQQQSQQSRGLLSKDFRPSEESVRAAQDYGLTEPEANQEFFKFIDYYVGNGTKKSDWQAALRSWFGRAADYKARNKPTATRSAVREYAPAQERYDGDRQENLRRLRDIMGGVLRKTPMLNGEGARHVQ